MTQVLDQQPGLHAFVRARGNELASQGPAWLRQLRKAAQTRFQELGLPTTRNEDWKFTNLVALGKASFAQATADRSPIAAPLLAPFALPGCIELVFVNGQFAPEASHVEQLPTGIVVTSMTAALRDHGPVLEERLVRNAESQDLAFHALNTASFQDGAFIAIPDGKVLEKPIHLLFLTTTLEPIMTQSRNLILAGTSSQVTVVETYAGQGQSAYFTNAVTEVRAKDAAVVDHYKIQREALSAYHVGNVLVHQQRGSNFSSQLVSLGGGLVRNESRVVFDGEGCECTFNGLYRGDGSQHIDNHTVIDHAQPHCASHELYKGILDGKARGVFNGKIFVRQDAQKTDAKQTNQTLLLSDDATINTKPQLEIYADDVKCTHGATVGQLDAESIFYLRSRGIGLSEARNLLTFAFANDIISRIKVEPLKNRLEELLLSAQHLPREESLQEAL